MQSYARSSVDSEVLLDRIDKAFPEKVWSCVASFADISLYAEIVRKHWCWKFDEVLNDCRKSSYFAAFFFVHDVLCKRRVKAVGIFQIERHFQKKF